MLSSSQLLVKHGFVKPEHKEEASSRDIRNVSEKEADTYAEQELGEEVNDQFVATGYPSPFKRYRLTLETFQNPIEEMYFWTLDFMRKDCKIHDIRKITDVFSASVQSSIWGSSSQRLSIQQEKASQYLVAIGQLMKTLFQIVRDIRVTDERLEIYRGIVDSKTKDITLKGLYTDLVEGGSKNPASVFGLSQQVGFSILPDLFFNTFRDKEGTIYDGEKRVTAMVDALDFNSSVKNLLKRKLYAYVNWKAKTEKELESRRKFTVRHLRQHWNTIKMYMAWVKPYLKNINRLSMMEKHHDSPDLISAFEGSMLEIELMGVKPKKGDFHPVVIATYDLRTRPTMSFSTEYQRGPIHLGKTTMTFRSYAWTEEQVKKYSEMRKFEDIELLGVVDGTVQAAMDSLGDELEKYLKEAEEEIAPKKVEEKKEEKKAAKKKMTWEDSMAGPFIDVFRGFWELFNLVIPISGGGKKAKLPVFSKDDKKAAAEEADKAAWAVYNIYKKTHGLIAW
ncbi:MAG: hypothetical protein V1659_05690 [Candidatus Woesearchaeota archaeon]